MLLPIESLQPPHRRWRHGSGLSLLASCEEAGTVRDRVTYAPGCGSFCALWHCVSPALMNTLLASAATLALHQKNRWFRTHDFHPRFPGLTRLLKDLGGHLKSLKLEELEEKRVRFGSSAARL